MKDFFPVDISLGPEPTRDDIFDLYCRAKDAFSAGEPLRLLSADLQRVPASLAQFIISCSRTAASGTGTFTLAAPSVALVDAFQAYGLFSDFMTISME
jgi:hypothetical protein